MIAQLARRQSPRPGTNSVWRLCYWAAIAFIFAWAAIYLLASYTIQTETQLRREGVCAFLISINLYFTIQFVCCGFVEHRRTAAVVSGIVSVFSSILLTSARPNFWFVVIVVMV